jgi:hypothetical protein
MRAGFQLLQPLLHLNSAGRQQQMERLLEEVCISFSSDKTSKFTLL